MVNKIEKRLFNWLVKVSFFDERKNEHITDLENTCTKTCNRIKKSARI